MGMPPREPSQMLEVKDDQLAIGKISNGRRICVGVQCGFQLMLLSPKAALRMAREFDCALAKNNDLGWVAEALRECAAEVKAMTQAEHIEMVAQSAAMAEGYRATRQ